MIVVSNQKQNCINLGSRRPHSGSADRKNGVKANPTVGHERHNREQQRKNERQSALDDPKEKPHGLHNRRVFLVQRSNSQITRAKTNHSAGGRRGRSPSGTESPGRSRPRPPASPGPRPPAPRPPAPRPPEPPIDSSSSFERKPS